MIAEAFSTETVYQPSGKEAAVINRYASVLPEGKYQIKVEFTLLPSDEKIIETHNFSVDKVPGDMKKALEDYRETLQYTAESHPVYGDGSYSFSHNSSIENYLKLYPENVYSQHLMHILTNWIYPYFKRTV